MRALINKKVNDEIKFKHKFHRENDYTVINGKIKEINENGVDCVVNTEFGDFYIGEWLIIE